MKILWIEDFDKNSDIAITAEDMFKDLFAEWLLDDEEEIEKALSALFENQSVHRLSVCKSYQEWAEKYKADDFDVILIDINLEANKTPAEKRPPDFLSDDDFDKRAGFYIYDQLIKNGFPDDNIGFFTANDDQLEEFAKACNALKIEKPKHPFTKGKNDSELRNWLSQKAATPYLTLRRGVIEGCRFLADRLNEKNSDLKDFLIFHKGTKGKRVPEDERLYALNYLKILERFFPPHPPVDKEGRENMYFLFLKELSADWEMNSRITGVTDITNLELMFETTCQNQMRILRNWTAHNKMDKELTEKDVAYLFITGMCAYMKSDVGKSEHYERILFELFEPFPDYKERIMNRNHLSESYCLLLKSCKEMKEGFTELVNEFGGPKKNPRETVQKWSLKLLFQAFWHGLFPTESSKAALRSGTNQVDIKITFIVDDLSQIAFLDELAKHIFNESFWREGQVIRQATRLSGKKIEIRAQNDSARLEGVPLPPDVTSADVEITKIEDGVVKEVRAI